MLNLNTNLFINIFIIVSTLLIINCWFNNNYLIIICTFITLLLLWCSLLLFSGLQFIAYALLIIYGGGLIVLYFIEFLNIYFRCSLIPKNPFTLPFSTNSILGIFVLDKKNLLLN